MLGRGNRRGEGLSGSGWGKRGLGDIGKVEGAGGGVGGAVGGSESALRGGEERAGRVKLRGILSAALRGLGAARGSGAGSALLSFADLGVQRGFLGALRVLEVLCQGSLLYPLCGALGGAGGLLGMIGMSRGAISISPLASL